MSEERTNGDSLHCLVRFFNAITGAKCIMDAPRMDANKQREQAITKIMDTLDRETYRELRLACENHVKATEMWAWWEAKDNSYLYVYPSRVLVEMNSPDGFKNDEANGRGKIMQVTVKPNARNQGLAPQGEHHD